jgi:hypothetical protein
VRLLTTFALLVTAGAAVAQRVPDRRFTGPALVCGEAFALRIGAGESAIKHDPGIDFLTYYVAGSYGSFVLYEGNAPQPHDDEIQTGLSFPGVIAIHDNRRAEAKAHSRIRDRLLVGSAFAAACRPPAHR